MKACISCGNCHPDLKADSLLAPVTCKVNGNLKRGDDPCNNYVPTTKLFKTVKHPKYV